MNLNLATISATEEMAWAGVVILGGSIGTYLAIKKATGPRERDFILESSFLFLLLFAAAVALDLALIPSRFKPWFYAICACGALLWFGRRTIKQTRIRKEESQSLPADAPSTQIIPPRQCPQCGAALKPHVPEGLCPACLLQRGIASEGGAPPGTPPFTPPPFAELKKLFPHLEILEPVGQGGMGAVYKARQPALDRIVALKILAPRSGSDVDFAERFTREARALAKLSHPNIVAVYDFGVVGQASRPSATEEKDEKSETGATPVLHYFVMEYVDGLNLRQIEQAGKLSPREALKIIPQICEALQFAHDEGIVHRDIKPENVLLDKKGRVKIADFGLAKILGQEAKDFRLTGARDVMGTPHYMAPEQVEHPQAVDHRADIYSLGVVFYEMLTGELPLGKFAPPSQRVHVDVRLDEVVLRSLEKEPARRYQHASDVKTRVETIASTPADGGPAGVSDAQIESVRREVKNPASWLVATGILNWVAIPAIVCLIVFGNIPGRSPNFLDLGFLAATLFLCSAIIAAGLKMKRLEGYSLAIIGSLLAIFITPGNIIGLPVGVWALVVLCRRDVRQAFGKETAKVWMRRQLLPEDKAARWAQLATFGAALGVLVIGTFQLTILDLQPYQLVFGILLVLTLTTAFLAYGTLLYKPPRTEDQKPSTPAPGLFPMAVMALFLAGLSGFFGIAAFCLFPRPPQILVWSIPTAALLGILLAIPARAHRLGKRALAIGSLNLAIWVAVFLAVLLLPKNPFYFGQTLPPNAIVTGQVSDAATGLPISGARVDDSRYGARARRTPQQAWTDASGRFELKTWSEEHTIAASAPGYETRLETAFSKPSAAGNQERLDFKLLPMARTNAALRSSGELRFGPVNDAVLPTLDGRTAKLLDLDTGAWATNTAFGENDRETHAWIRRNRVDLSGVIEKGQIGILCMDMAIVPASGNHWETVTAQDVATNWALGQEEPNKITAIAPVMEKTDIWMFRTREGGRGLLQILGQSDAPRGVKIRYKLLVHSQSGDGPVHVAATFASVIERVVSGEGDANRRFIDFDTGRLFAAAEFFGTNAEPSPAETQTWWRETGVDAMGDTSPAVRGLVGFEMAAVPAPDEEWESATPARLGYYLTLAKVGTPVTMSGKGPLPATFVIQTREGGRGLLQITGFTDSPPGLIIRYRLVQTAAAETWSPSLAPGERPDLQKIRDEIKSLMDRGRYEAALKRQIWYFNHAMEFGEANPVRLSFGIMNWAELGRRYPKAKQALVEIRDRDTQALLLGKGGFNLFQEAAALNRELQDPDATDTLFKAVERRNPQLARQGYFVVEGLLVQKGEYETCRKYMGDPQFRFESARLAFETELDRQKRMTGLRQMTAERLDRGNRQHGWTNTPALSLPDTSAMVKKSAQDRFVGQVRQLIEILVATGRKSDAGKIRDEAVAVLDDARLKSAVQDAEREIQRHSAGTPSAN